MAVLKAYLTGSPEDTVARSSTDEYSDRDKPKSATLAMDLYLCRRMFLVARSPWTILCFSKNSIPLQT